MGRLRDFRIAYAVLAALVVWPASGLAITIDSSLDTSTVMLGTGANVNGEITIVHDGSTIGSDVVVTGTLPAGYTINSLNITPMVILGEMSYNTYDKTRLLTVDLRDGSVVDGLQVVLSGVPEASQPCGIYGFDVNPITGEYYALIGLQPPGDTCYYAQSVRDLFKIDPKTGVATWLGSPPVKLNGLAFGPTGQLFGHGSNGAPRRGGLYKVSTVNGATSSFVSSPIPGAAVTWNNAPTVGLNPVDGLMYHFYECEVATTNPSSGVQSAVVDTDTGNCPSDDYMVASYLGESQFLILNWSDMYYFNVANLEWSYIDSTDDVRGGVGAGLDKTLSASCTENGTTFTCTIPRIIPRGRYTIELDGYLAPASVADAPFTFSAGGVSSTKTVSVVAADLTVTAKANATRVDQSDNVVWTVDAENLGTAAAGNTQLVVKLPANQTYSTYTASQGSCNQSSGTVTCSLGSVAGGILARVKITSTANADGVSEIDASVSTSSVEASATNNDTKARVVVGPAADLAVSASLTESAADASAATSAPGKAVKVSVVVTNEGPNDATDVKLYQAVPANMTVTGTGCTVAGGKLACDVGTVAVDASKTIELSATASKSGRYALDVSAESFTIPDFNVANNTDRVTIDVTPPSVQVAAGPKSPREAGTGEMAPLAQLVLTHGGQTDQALRVTSLKVEGSIARLNQQTVRVLVINDLDGNGVKGADEGVIGNGDLSVNGDATSIRLAGDGIKLEKGESVTVLIVLRDAVSATNIASIGGGSAMAALGILPVMLLFGLRRRNLAIVAGFAMVMFGAAACTTEETESGAKIQLTVTAVEAELADGGGPAAPVDGLPLALPTVEVK